MFIEVIDVANQTKPTKSGKGTYQELTVTFKDDGGKIQGKKIFSFSNKDVFERLVVATKGDTFDVESKKNDAGYWEWVDIARADAPPKSPTPATPVSSAPVSRSNYETPEERAVKQLHIARQSSISNAIALLGQGAEVDNVLTVAQRFVEFVYGEYQEPMTMENLQDDFPI